MSFLHLLTRNYQRDGSLLVFDLILCFIFVFFLFCCRDGRLAEGDQILAIDGQVLEAAISHQAAIGILQRARGVVDLVVARGVNPEVPHIPLISLQQSQQSQQPSSIVEFAQQQQLIQQEKTQQQQQQQHKLQQQLSSPASSTRSRSSQSSQHSATAASSSSRSASPQPPTPQQQQQQQPPSASLLSSSPTPTSFTTLTTTDPIKNNNGVDVVEIITTASLAAPSLGRSPSALSDGSKTGGDMVVCNTTLFFFLSFLSFFLSFWPSKVGGWRREKVVGPPPATLENFFL